MCFKLRKRFSSLKMQNISFLKMYIRLKTNQLDETQLVYGDLCTCLVG